QQARARAPAPTQALRESEPALRSAGVELGAAQGATSSECGHALAAPGTNVRTGSHRADRSKVGSESAKRQAGTRLKTGDVRAGGAPARDRRCEHATRTRALTPVSES